jgi:hypothetical protein
LSTGRFFSVVVGQDGLLLPGSEGVQLLHVIEAHLIAPPEADILSNQSFNEAQQVRNVTSVHTRHRPPTPSMRSVIFLWAWNAVANVRPHLNPTFDLVARMVGRVRGFVIAEQLIVAIAEEWSFARDAEGGIFTDSIAYYRSWIGKDRNPLRIVYDRVVGNLAAGVPGPGPPTRI